MKYLSIRNWEKYQHYKDRRPPWIKLYPSMFRRLEHPDIVALPPLSRFLAVAMLALASEQDNLIPASPQWISAEISLPASTVKRALDDLRSINFVEDRASKSASRDASAPIEQRTEVSKSSDLLTRQRPRDPLWDALADEMGGQPATNSERGRWNKALKEIRDAGGTAEELHAKATAYRKRWPEISFTALALAANWGALGYGPNGAKKAPPPPCDLCGVGGGMHVADCPNAKEAT